MIHIMKLPVVQTVADDRILINNGFKKMGGSSCGITEGTVLAFTYRD
jgi:hypothetical protein